MVNYKTYYIIPTTVDPGVGGEKLTSKTNHHITHTTHNGTNRHATFYPVILVGHFIFLLNETFCPLKLDCWCFGVMLN